MALLLREAIGGTIRRARTARRRTLRDVSRDARVSLGYLSEIERGRKEPSSELLAAICNALALSLPDLLDDVADSLRPDTPRRVPARLAERRLVGVDPALRSAVEEAFGAAEPATDDAEAPPVDGAPAAATTGPAAPVEVVDLAADPAPHVVVDDDPGTFGDLGDETPEPAGELRVVEIVTLGRGPAGAVRSAA
jgi:XRE family transcriptional regulator, stress-response regulator